ncbi:MAG: glycosyltransferase [Planctomycetes bacterium]|nr:glycosyltransferase [Planctomycetota bacterium]
MNSPFFIFQAIAAILYSLCVCLLCLYGLHSLWLLFRFLRYRKEKAQTPENTQPNSAVLVQLPIYNERDVVTRLLECISQLEWPKSLLRIQLLDDSTDDSIEIGKKAIAEISKRGINITHVTRTKRIGYKAGALEEGLKLDAMHADGPAPFVAIFDADFLPHADFLRKALPSLENDNQLAFIQGRWEHLNRNKSFLTRAQAMGIDGHFAIEQGARAWSGLALNFNGTCGVWRVEAIHDAGGWQHDTLTEDMDLSYRAHLKGWRGAYDLDLDVPGEIPHTLEAWRAQQFRWAKGSLQTARKLLPKVWSSDWKLVKKCAATAHMTHYLVHPLILLSLAFAPLAIPFFANTNADLILIGLACLLCGMFCPILLYIASQLVLRRPLKHYLALPLLTAMGTGIAISNSRAAIDVFRDRVKEFIRTPKYGDSKGSYRAKESWGLVELLAASWGIIGIAFAWQQSSWIMPILAIYVSGFLHHGCTLLANRINQWKA